MALSIPVTVVDAFTKQAFAGNPAAVCILPELLPSSVMQKVAMEMNLSETAFAAAKAEEETEQKIAHYVLKWFTPTNEVNLCGHATLATAHALFQDRESTRAKICFHTLSGILTVEKLDHGALQMDFPLGDPRQTSLTETTRNSLCQGLNLDPSAVIEVAFCSKTRKLLLQVVSVTNIRTLNPQVTE